METKQETLEEANWKVLGTKKDTFYNGAKWQAERMYSEEDMIKFLDFEYNWLLINKYRKAANDYKPYGLGKDVSRKELLQLWKEQQPKIVYYE